MGYGLWQIELKNKRIWQIDEMNTPYITPDEIICMGYHDGKQ